MQLDAMHMYWAISRMGLRFFTEGIFIYLIVNNINNQNVCKKSNTLSKKKMLLFSSFYLLIVLSIAFAFPSIYFFRLASFAFIFFYFYCKQRKVHEKLVSRYNNTQNIWYALTTAIILTLAVHSFNIISYTLFHNTFVVTGIYETVRSIDVAYQFYKTAIVFLDLSLMFLVYKFRFIKTRDLKNMSMHKRIPISFAFCLLSMIYLDSVYDVTPSSFVWYCQSLMWAMALMLPTYIGFYLTTAYLTRLLSLRSNTTADVRILVWLSNPSMMKTTHLDVYNSKVFIANFELKKLDIKKRLEKLGINDEYKGYSGLILCLFLTRLFIGLKGWNFATDVFWQTSLVIDVGASKLRKDIENIIDQVWNTSEVETLIDGYYLPYHNINIYDQTRRPTVEQFLTDVAKSI